MTRRWQDSDVRSRFDLWELATDYLTQYTGDFPFLIEARRALASGGPLRVPVIRGVLNCMSADSRVLDMPEPVDSSFDAAPRRRGIMFEEEEEPRPMVAPPRPMTPVPQSVFLKVRWKMSHGVINSKQAKALHLIDPLASIAKMRPGADKVSWEIGWICKSRATYYSPIDGRIFLINPLQARLTIEKQCLVMSPRQFNGHEMKGGLLREWRECKQCLLLADRSTLAALRKTS